MGERSIADLTRLAFERWNARNFDGLLELFEEDAVEERLDWGLVTILQHARGGSSGAPVPFRYYGVGRWRDGRLVFVENYMDAELARDAFRRYTEESSVQPEAVP